MRNFVISGMGRSGTLFLATALNRSPTWTVEHEPHLGWESVSTINRRLGRDAYGEVNSCLRWQLLSLDVSYRAVIVRDPVQIFQSMFNRGRANLPQLLDSLAAIDGLIQAGVEAISFRAMTSDENAASRIAANCGIDDLPSGGLGGAANASIPREAPVELLDHAKRKTEWFVKEYADILFPLATPVTRDELFGVHV